MAEDEAQQATEGGPEHHVYAGEFHDRHFAASFAAGMPLAAGALATPASASNIAESATDAYTDAQLQQLRTGQEMRGDAPGPISNYAAYPHEDLHRMVNENLSTDTIDARGQVMTDIGNWLADVSTAANDAVTKEQTAWQGPAAEQAHALFRNNATWADGTAQAAWLSANRYAEQSDAAANARSTMPPPSDFSEEAEMAKVRDQLSSGNIVDAAGTYFAIDEKKAQAQAQHDEAVRVMDTMDQSYQQTASTQPAFQPPPSPASTNAGGTHVSSYVQPAAPGGTTPGVTGSTYSGPNSAAQPGTSSPAPVASGGRSYSGAAPPATSTPGTNYGGYSGTSANSPTAGRGFYGAADAAGRAGSLRGVGSETTRTGRGGGSGGYRSTSSAPRAGGSSAAPRATGGTAKGDTPDKAPSSGRGTGAAPGSKAPVARGGAAAAAKAADSATSGRPVGGMPAGGRRGKDDEEQHERKYETGEDPDEVYEPTPEFGPNGERVAPPVIGE